MEQWRHTTKVDEWTALGILIVSGSVFIFTACVPQKVNVTSSPGFDSSRIRTLAILPFQTLATPQRFTPQSSQVTVAPTEIRSQFRLPASGPDSGRLSNSASMKVPMVAAQRITRMVYASLEHRPHLHLVPVSEVERALSGMSKETTENLSEKVKHVGSQLDADAVIVGLVRTYREREGTKIGATPAAVGFEVHLVEARTGKIYWTGEYYEEQKPLNEDLVGFVERGGAFVTAAELAEYGVHKMMKQLSVGQEG